MNRRPECNTLSNALFASKETQKTLLPLDVKYRIDNVNVEFKVTLHEQIRYTGTLQY